MSTYPDFGDSPITREYLSKYTKPNLLDYTMELLAKLYQLAKDITGLRDTLLITDSNLQEMTKERDKLVYKLNDWSETYMNIIGDKTCPDEIHCACVPALREEIGKLHDLIDFYQACGFVVIEHVEDDGRISKFVSHAGAEYYPPRPV